MCVLCNKLFSIYRAVLTCFVPQVFEDIEMPDKHWSCITRLPRSALYVHIYERIVKSSVPSVRFRTRVRVHKTPADPGRDRHERIWLKIEMILTWREKLSFIVQAAPADRRWMTNGITIAFLFQIHVTHRFSQSRTDKHIQAYTFSISEFN